MNPPLNHNIIPSSTFFPTKNVFCSYCGSKFVEQITYPRMCWTCHNESYANPAPVVVMFIQVWDKSIDPNDVGILVQQRNIEPKKGYWAFPSGYIDLGETWQEACVRECQEEMGLTTSPDNYKPVDVMMGSSNNTLLIIAEHMHSVNLEDIKFVPNSEVSNIRIAWEYEELAFPSHTAHLAKYYASL